MHSQFYISFFKWISTFFPPSEAMTVQSGNDANANTADDSEVFWTKLHSLLYFPLPSINICGYSLLCQFVALRAHHNKSITDNLLTEQKSGPIDRRQQREQIKVLLSSVIVERLITPPSYIIRAKNALLQALSHNECLLQTRQRQQLPDVPFIDEGDSLFSSCAHIKAYLLTWGVFLDVSCSMQDSQQSSKQLVLWQWIKEESEIGKNVCNELFEHLCVTNVTPTVLRQVQSFFSIGMEQEEQARSDHIEHNSHAHYYEDMQNYYVYWPENTALDEAIVHTIDSDCCWPSPPLLHHSRVGPHMKRLRQIRRYLTEKERVANESNEITEEDDAQPLDEKHTVEEDKENQEDHENEEATDDIDDSKEERKEEIDFKDEIDLSIEKVLDNQLLNMKEIDVEEVFFGKLSSLLYLRTLHLLPAVTRAWWSQCTRPIAAKIFAHTVQYYSPLVIQEEISALSSKRRELQALRKQREEERRKEKKEIDPVEDELNAERELKSLLEMQRDKDKITDDTTDTNPWTENEEVSDAQFSVRGIYCCYL